MKKYELYRSERENGLTYREIAAKYGVSRQNVAQACGKMRKNYFKPYRPEEVVYPNLRRWLNDNRVSRSEFLRRMQFGWGNDYQGNLALWFRGERFPRKLTIDKMLEVTGLTYEEMFSPVETEKRGTARWKKEIEGNFYWYVCSHCGADVPKNNYKQDYYSRFCPDCGWPMEVDEE